MNEARNVSPRYIATPRGVAETLHGVKGRQKQHNHSLSLSHMYICSAEAPPDSVYKAIPLLFTNWAHQLLPQTFNNTWVPRWFFALLTFCVLLYHVHPLLLEALPSLGQILVIFLKKECPLKGNYFHCDALRPCLRVPIALLLVWLKTRAEVGVCATATWE